MSNYKETLEEIVNTCTAGKIDGVLVDLYSASTLLTVYDAISEENLTKLTSKPIADQVGLAFKLIEKVKSK